MEAHTYTLLKKKKKKRYKSILAYKNSDSSKHLFSKVEEIQKPAMLLL